jgi:predicted homoserine dehydrogenase-like protein
MIIIDTALKKRLAEGNPVRVALVASGYMGRAIVRVIRQSFPGIQVAAIANRTVERAKETYRDAGVSDFREVKTPAQLDKAIEDGVCAVTDDPAVACRAGRIEAVIETSGDVEFGAVVSLEALTHGKHLVLMNAEVDAAVGPVLKEYADRNDAVYTYTDGDEPGVAMNLFRFVASIGYKPVMLGQIKGFLNRYRNPDTQKEFAAKHGQKPAMVASFADGSKLALEATIMANATGFKPAKTGMYGHECKHVKDLLQHFGPKDFTRGGLVDFALGAEPGTGAFVIGYNDDPVLKQYMAYFKFGDGPLYLFYTPYHLPHLQLPHSVARAVLFHDPTLTPLGAPVCDAVAYAKRDLKAGETLDGMGGFTNYGLVDTYENSRAQDFLPMSLSVDCTLLRDVAKDAPLRYSDVKLPEGRTCDRLRAEQTARFPKAVPVAWA